MKSSTSRSSSGWLVVDGGLYSDVWLEDFRSFRFGSWVGETSRVGKVCSYSACWFAVWLWLGGLGVVDDA